MSLAPVRSVVDLRSPIKPGCSKFCSLGPGDGTKDPSVSGRPARSVVPGVARNVGQTAGRTGSGRSTGYRLS